MVDTADTDASSHTDVEVTVLSPARAPRVTDDVVVGRSRGHVAYDDDGVVGGSTASARSVGGDDSR